MLTIPRHRALRATAIGALLVTGTATAGTPAAGADTVYVQPAGTATLYTQPLLRSSPQDRAITERVVAVLAGDHRLQGEQIGVTTVDGVVTLSGHVRSPARVYRAVELARQVSGVRAVRDEPLDA